MSSKDWLVTVLSTPVIGLAKDSNIIVEMADDKITVSSGIGGDWSFVENPSEESSVTFTTQRTSASNAMLHALYKARRVVPVTVSNLRNGTVHTLAYAMIRKQPNDGANNGADAQEMEWAFVSGETDSTII